MELTLEMRQILELVKALAREGVTSFTWGDLHLVLGSPPETPISTRSDTAVKKSGSVWTSPSLWPGGVPPKFPTE